MNTASPSGPWGRGDPYERYMGRWSRQLAPRFLAWLGAPPGQRWLDVGCGTGALSEAILAQSAPASVVGVEPAEGFLASARQNLGSRATLLAGSAAALPLPDAAVDSAVASLVLNFVPDAPAALREMARVTRPGGTVAACVWDYGGVMPLMTHFWDAAAALDPAVAGHAEGLRFALCKPDALLAAFTQGGLHAPQVGAIELPMRFVDFDDYWQPFLGGQGPAPAYAVSLSEAARGRLRERLRAQLPVQPDGSIALVARAWAVRGTVAG